MRVAIDYTAALRQRGGVGRYTRDLIDALLAEAPSDEFLLWYASDCASDAPLAANVIPRRLPLPSRWLTIGWQRLGLPVTLERLIGPIDLAHAPDFVAPPSRAPAIATIHDLSYLIAPEFAHPALRRYLEAAVPRTLARAARVLAVSETTRGDLIEHYGLDPDRVVAIPNGIDRRFRPPLPEEIENALRLFALRQPYFLIVGTIEPRKNHLALLRAFERVRQVYPEAALVIIGQPGWLAEPIVARIEAAAQRLPVRFLRFVDDRWLPALYAASTALVYPSWYEGFGLPVLEAMACGAAAIAGDRGALPELVGELALLVSPASDEAITQAMLSLLDDPARQRRLAAAGPAWAARFTWERAARSTLAVYREVAA
ncbi:MAG TPA: glycosyltransferase family 1 protein [Thermomicrobiaceae bacterium]|nr:glycosyltransferase family 1 protein [Thermomicrobiaceae bacterium]